MPALSEGAPKRGAELQVAWRASVGDFATSLSWSSDGALCAVGAASGAVHVLDGETGALRWMVEAHPGGVLAVAWSPRERLLATAGQDGTAKLLRGDDGARIATLPGASAWVEHLAWSPDGALLATASGRAVRLWRADGAPHLATEPHGSTVSAIAWSPQGTELASACYGGVHLFRVESGVEARHLAWKGSLVSLAWSPDGKVIACGSQDCTVHFWRLASGEDSAMQGYPFKPKALAWSGDASLLATGGGAQVTIWRFDKRGPEGTTPIVLDAHLGAITDLAFDPRTGQLASGAQDAGVIVWEPRRSRKPAAFGFLDDHVSRVAFRPEHGGLAAADASGTVVTWRRA
jgi:WD40 repeat protein